MLDKRLSVLCLSSGSLAFSVMDLDLDEVDRPLKQFHASQDEKALSMDNIY